MSKFKHVLLVFETRRTHAQNICKGIFNYARPALQWDFLIQPPDQLDEVRKMGWQPDAVIGQFGNMQLCRKIAALNVPTINIYGGDLPESTLPQLGVEDRALGAVAAEYFLSSGFQHFAYFSLPGRGFQTGRLNGFREPIENSGRKVHVFSEKNPFAPADTGRVAGQRSNLESWLLALPKPIALLGCDSTRAVWAGDACRHLELKVPDQIAVLGIDDDELLCNEPYPPLSAVEIPGREEGYRAAELLHNLLKGRPVPKKPIRLQPGQVVVRTSTNYIAVADDHVKRALHYIRQEACNNLRVEQVAAHAGLSRRVLEKRFRSMLQSSPHREIRKQQLIHIKKLLSETTLSTAAIAEASGFSSNIRLCSEFKKETGLSPIQYRKQFTLR